MIPSVRRPGRLRQQQWVTTAVALLLLLLIGLLVLKGYSLAAALTGVGTAVIVARDAADRLTGGPGATSSTGRWAANEPGVDNTAAVEPTADGIESDDSGRDVR